jgi:hypothetical protein
MEMKIDWEDIEQILSEIIGKKIPMEEGMKYLDEQVFQRTGFHLLQDLETNRLGTEFNDWMIRVLNTQLIPLYIKSVYFGIFTIIDPRYNGGVDTTAVHFMGSSSIPEDNVDWACEDTGSFLPESRYMVFTDFSLLDVLVKEKALDGSIEVLLYNGIVSLLVINNIEKHSGLLLRTSFISPKESYRDSLCVGCGFDSGDAFILGKITGNGFL